jgi:hypothetical protein
MRSSVETGCGCRKCLTPLRALVAKEDHVTTKAERVEAPLASTERKQIEQATVVPAAYFDQLVASLDEPEEASRLARAAAAARRRGRIKPT